MSRKNTDSKPGHSFDILPYHESFRPLILDTWERSVLATHNFLSPEDFQSIKAAVQTIDFNAFALYCLVRDQELAGFIGVADKKIEMLFIAPEHFGKGLGKKLAEFAIRELKADKVDVNEQNSKAVSFYTKPGFRTYERTEKDDQGKDYPLLRMKLGS